MPLWKTICDTSKDKSMKQYNLISTQNIVPTGIAELDERIVGMYIGETTIIFGNDKEGVRRFFDKMEIGCKITSDPNLESRMKRKICVCDCEHRDELPHPEMEIAENVLQIVEREGRHYVRVWKNRMNGVHDFECEIK